MFFSKPGEYEPCGIFTLGHLKLIILTAICITMALKNTVTKNKNEIKNIIKNCTITMWTFEVIIITFKLCTGDIRNVNNYVPLYYCSLLLYAGMLSSFAKGKLERVGNVFLATGGIVGGVVFMILPTTSLPSYPMFHLVSIHSYIFHGVMVYLGLLINLTQYIEIEKNDIKYYASLVGCVCILAFIVNNIFDSNLMFISKNFPGTPIEIIYKYTGRLFTLVMSVGQMTLPFYCVYEVIKIRKEAKRKEMLCQYQ